MRKRNRKAKRKEKKGKREKRETVLRKKWEENEKGGKGRGRISRVSGGRRSKVRGLSWCTQRDLRVDAKKVGVSTNSKR